MGTADILAPRFTDEDKAREFLEAKRWPDGAVCPHCGVIGQAYRLQPKENGKSHVRKGVWKCGSCREQFTVTVGTIFADSHIPLNKWLMAFHFLAASKKGVSAHQLHRMLGVTYKSAWFMAHRIRYAMSQEPLSSKLSGTVEVDEVYIGPKEKHTGFRGVAHPLSKKLPVVSMVERSLVKGKGRVKSVPVNRVTLENLKPILQEHIETGATLNTDEGGVYFWLKDIFPDHHKIAHKSRQYVRFHDDGRKVTTNTVEGYFSIRKRGVHGTYHHIGSDTSTCIAI
jgi:transposase-like protein